MWGYYRLNTSLPTCPPPDRHLPITYSVLLLPSCPSSSHDTLPSHTQSYHFPHVLPHDMTPSHHILSPITSLVSFLMTSHDTLLSHAWGPITSLMSSLMTWHPPVTYSVLPLPSSFLMTSHYTNSHTQSYHFPRVLPHDITLHDTLLSHTQSYHFPRVLPHDMTWHPPITYSSPTTSFVSFLMISHHMTPSYHILSPTTSLMSFLITSHQMTPSYHILASYHFPRFLPHHITWHPPITYSVLSNKEVLLCVAPVCKSKYVASF